MMPGRGESIFGIISKKLSNSKRKKYDLTVSSYEIKKFATITPHFELTLYFPRTREKGEKEKKNPDWIAWNFKLFS